jgi:hypothetical protein
LAARAVICKPVPLPSRLEPAFATAFCVPLNRFDSGEQADSETYGAIPIFGLLTFTTSFVAGSMKWMSPPAEFVRMIRSFERAIEQRAISHSSRPNVLRRRGAASDAMLAPL